MQPILTSIENDKARGQNRLQSISKQDMIAVLIGTLPPKFDTEIKIIKHESKINFESAVKELQSHEVKLQMAANGPDSKFESELSTQWQIHPLNPVRIFAKVVIQSKIVTSCTQNSAIDPHKAVVMEIQGAEGGGLINPHSKIY